MFPGHSVLRTGTVDDFSLHETKLKPRIEVFNKDRVNWLCGGNGVEQFKATPTTIGDSHSNSLNRTVASITCIPLDLVCGF